MGYNKNPRVKFTCDWCSKEASDRPSHYARKRRHFCSQYCYTQFRRFELPVEEHNRFGTGMPEEERLKRRKARSDLNHAIRDGKVERKPCEVITCVEWPEAHHDDYNKPLEVRWLCFTHHRAFHYENPDLLKV